MNDSKSSNYKREFSIKGGKKILTLIKNFSSIEKVLFTILLMIAIISTIIMTYRINELFLIPVPAHGGSLTEGIIGLPRSINPVLAFTNVDRDLSTLIYSGLMKYENDTLVGDLAEKYDISDDGLTYTFTLRKNLFFHDKEPLTTDDVEFTIQKIQDGTLKSPHRADWANVTIKKVNSEKIQFILKQPYSPFLSNTTIGILPKHIWKNLDSDQFIFSQYNTEAIGSGPYKINNIKKDGNGIPIIFNLVSFNKYYNGEPFISNLNINLYQNESLAIDAYNIGAVQNIAGISPMEITKIATTTYSSRILNTPLPRIFGLFFNQNNAPVLNNKDVRTALNLAIDKEKLVEKVLYGYGVSINGPVPINKSDNDVNKTGISDKEAAKALLAKNGWVINKDGILEKKEGKTSEILSFSISTADTPDLKNTAEILKSEWESIGAQISIKIFEYGDLSQNIIKTRKYDALLFGEFIGKDLDLYAFWHSSQRNYPGLNISMYVNSKVDKLLEDMRLVSTEDAKKDKYIALEKIINDEMPAIFLYSPEYVYIVPNKLKGINLGPIANPSERLYGIDKWYMTTDNVWKIFTHK